MNDQLLVISYVGLPLSGRSTSLGYLADTLSDAHLSERRIGQARELVLEAAVPSVPGLRCRLQASIGAVFAPSVWKTEVATADGLVLVVDPQPARYEQQMAFCVELQDTIARARWAPQELPIVVQVNKRDLCPSEAEAFRPQSSMTISRHLMSDAVHGIGVLEAMMACVDAVRAVHPGAAMPPPSWLPFASPE